MVYILELNCKRFATSGLAVGGEDWRQRMDANMHVKQCQQKDPSTHQHTAKGLLQYSSRGVKRTDYITVETLALQAGKICVCPSSESFLQAVIGFVIGCERANKRNLLQLLHFVFRQSLGGELDSRLELQAVSQESQATEEPAVKQTQI